jgi:pantoate--beta-alanine ligase
VKVFKTVDSVKRNLSNIDKKFSLGLVPTMGALHKGHLSIIKRAKKENDLVIVSIFINPTQFDKAEDLKNYPVTLNADLKLLEEIDCDFVFVPTADEIYNSNIISEKFDFNGLDKVMEGEHRKGHFDGVGTIVKMLFDIIKPTRAYFGEKDFQQLQIIKRMVELKGLPIQIIACEIFREKDGLAMSSRNSRLNKAQREAAPLIYRSLLKCKELFLEKDMKFIKDYIETEFKKDVYLQLEYFEIANVKSLTPAIDIDKNKKYRAFIAAFSGSVRLIDNIALN